MLVQRGIAEEKPRRNIRSRPTAAEGERHRARSLAEMVSAPVYIVHLLQ
jgi:hypothetical protein